MKITDVSWRARVGGFNRATHLSISSTPRGMDSFLQGMVCALTLAILLMVAGVEMNPGPVSVSYKSVNFARSFGVCANEDEGLGTRHSEENVRVGIPYVII